MTFSGDSSMTTKEVVTKCLFLVATQKVVTESETFGSDIWCLKVGLSVATIYFSGYFICHHRKPYFQWRYFFATKRVFNDN